MAFVPKADPGIGRESAPVGSKAWAERVRLRMQGAVSEIDQLPEHFHFYVQLVTQHKAWTLMNKPDGLFFATFEEFCEHRQPWGLGRPWADLRLYVVAACGGDEAKVAALTTSPGAAPTHAEAVKEQSRDVKGRVMSEGVRSVPSDTKQRKYGETSAYLAARIARDAPEVHEKMKAGGYPSVRAAALEAGIVKLPDPVKRAVSALKKVPAERAHELLSVDVRGIQMAIRRLTHEEQDQLCAWLVKEVSRQ